MLAGLELARLMHISVKALYRLVRAEVVPPPIRLGPKILRWRTETGTRFLRREPGESA